MELPRRAPVGESVVIVGLELTEFTTGATGKVGPTGVIVFEAGFKVGVLILLSQKVAGKFGSESVTWTDSRSAARRLKMDRQVADHSESRFAAYVQALTSVMGHAHRAAALKDYCVGLLATEGRKSVEPIAAVKPTGSKR
jgi:hypothetical protein